MEHCVLPWALTFCVWQAILGVQAWAQQWLGWHWLQPLPLMVENIPLHLHLYKLSKCLTYQPVLASLFMETYLKFPFARCGVRHGLDESRILQTLGYGKGGWNWWWSLMSPQNHHDFLQILSHKNWVKGTIVSLVLCKDLLTKYNQ